MSMLAERKTKTRWTINPLRKPLWMTDSDGIKFGKNLMEKMGWSAGKGLGVDEQGIKEPLKVSYKNDTEGMGYKENSESWIEHQDEFNNFLNQLRSSDDSFVVKTEVEKEVKSLEEKSKVSKVRVHYQKFTRGKDLSRYSENDLACILGTSKTQKEKSPTEGTELAPAEPENVNNFGVTTISGGSLQDYFKRKWIFSKNTGNSNCANDNMEQNHGESFPSKCNEEESSQVEDERKCKKRKHNSNSEEFMDVELNMTLDSNKLENSEKKKKKKRKKDLESEEEPKTKRNRQNSVDLLNDPSVEVIPDRNKEGKSKNLMTENENGICDLGELEIKEKNTLHTDVSKVNEDFCDSGKKKSKKSLTNSSFQDQGVSEITNDANEESYVSRKESKENKKRKRAKEETLEEKDELGKEDLSRVQSTFENVKELSYQVNGINSKSENDISSEEFVLKKKKKKEKKDKHFEIDEKERKDSSNIFLNCKTNREAGESLDVEIITKSKKKKKRDKKEKLIIEKDDESNEDPIDQNTDSYKDEKNVKSVNEITPEVKIVKEKNKKKSKKEILVEGEDVEFIECCNNQNMKPSQEKEKTSNASELEVILEIDTVKKKKTKKDKKEKFAEKVESEKNCSSDVINLCVENFKNDSVKKKSKKEKTDTEKNSSIHGTDSYIDEKNIGNANERKEAPEIEFLKEKKKKKDKSEKLIGRKEIEFVEDSTQNTKYDIEGENITNANEVEVMAEIELVKKKRKKKDKKVENFNSEINNLELEEKSTENEVEVYEKADSVKEKKKKKDKKGVENFSNHISDITNLHTDGESIKSTNENNSEVGVVKKQKKKKDKKVLVEEEEKIENTNEVEVLAETESVKKKKKKKDKKEKDGMKSDIKEHSNDHTMEENNYKNKENTTQEEDEEKKEKKQKKKNSENIPEHNHKEQEKEENAKNTETNNTKINFSNNYCFEYQNSNNINFSNYFLYYNYYNNMCSFNNVEPEHSLQNHKVEFLNEKRIDKFYPGQYKTRVLRLIHWADFSEFKGSNLSNLMGYGFQSLFIKNKLSNGT